MNYRIGITGPNGRLGSQFVLMGGIPMSCDLRDEDDVAMTIAMIKPDVIINCAAFTDVDVCETEEGWKKAVAVNMRGVDRLRRLFSGKLIHISTDYVYDGKRGPYSEKQSEYNPVNRYGSSKLGGDLALLNPEDTTKETHIVRTTGLYGATMSRDDFANLVITTLSGGQFLQVTKELMGNQTYIPHLAEAILKLAGMECSQKIINIGSKEVMSRYDFALTIASIFALNKELLIPCKNQDIASWKAERPSKGGLKTTLATNLRLPIYTILDGLKRLRDDTRGV